MTDRTPPLATHDEAADRLGRDELAEALEAGTVRRVQHAGAEYLLGADVDRLARESDPRHLARLVSCEGDDSDDGPRALAERQRRL